MFYCSNPQSMKMMPVFEGYAKEFGNNVVFAKCDVDKNTETAEFVGITL